MLDPTLCDRLMKDQSKLSLDALEYIDGCHELMIELKAMLIEKNCELIAARERTTYLNQALEKYNGSPAQKISAAFGRHIYTT